MRTEIYEHYLGHPTRFDRDENPSWERIHHAPSEAFGDLGTTGELMEVFAFFTLREGNFELASRYFDYAAIDTIFRGYGRPAPELSGHLTMWSNYRLPLTPEAWPSD